MNSVNAIGNICRDVEVKTSKAGKSYSVNSLAVRDYNGETTYIPFKVFGKAAEIFARCRKGQKIGISGILKSGTFEKNGKKEYSLDVIANDIQFMSQKEADPASNVNSYPTDAFASDASPAGGDFNSDDCPF
jgi:Single-stranded DNA-binding protein